MISAILWLLAHHRAPARRLRHPGGSAMVLAALMAVVLFGSAALALDVGLAIVTQRQLQNAADAAALAAVAELPGDPAGTVQAALHYAGLNGADLGATDVTVGPTYVDNDTVRVEPTETVTFLFAPVIGIDEGNVSASAVARVGSLCAASGLVPWGLVVPEGGFQFGQTYELKVGPGAGGDDDDDDEESGSGSGGNYNALALGGTGATIYRSNVVYGTPDSYEKGQTIQMESGNMKGPTRQALIRRIGSDPYTRWTDLVNFDGTLNGIDDDNPRIIIIPTISEPRHGRSTVTITGFAIFYVDGSPNTWDGTEVRGAFIRDVVHGDMGPLSSDPWIPRVVALVE